MKMRKCLFYSRVRLRHLKKVPMSQSVSVYKPETIFSPYILKISCL